MTRPSWARTPSVRSPDVGPVRGEIVEPVREIVEIREDSSAVGGGARTYTHHQEQVSDTWVVEHGLGRRPVAWSLYDHNDRECDTYTVRHPDLNRCVVEMEVPTKGRFDCI